MFAVDSILCLALTNVLFFLGLLILWILAMIQTKACSPKKVCDVIKSIEGSKMEMEDLLKEYVSIILFLYLIKKKTYSRDVICFVKFTCKNLNCLK